jgi:hypothetical protein
MLRVVFQNEQSTNQRGGSLTPEEDAGSYWNRLSPSLLQIEREGRRQNLFHGSGVHVR